MADAQPSAQGERDQPGLNVLREAVANSTHIEMPAHATLRADAAAGLNTAISSIPDGMASGILAGVNPIYGLYAAMAGPIAGGIFSSSRLMIVTTTSASALAAGQAVSHVAPEDRAASLFTMVLLIGAFQVVLGLLHLGRIVRFVSYSVMTGFIAGIAVLTVLTQLPAATGYQPSGDNRVTQTIDLFAHAGQINWLSLGLAALALALAVILPRTPLGNLGMLVAITVPSVLVFAFGWASVQAVRDIGGSGGGIPRIFIPGPSDFDATTLTGAFAVAMIVLVQGAGVSQSVPNPDGSRSSISRDFIGQGAGNLASGFIHGIPVGGSLSSTALNVMSGARSRWAAILSGCWVGIIVIALPGLVGHVAMPTLAALLIVASAAAIPLRELQSLWRINMGPRVVMLTTFAATLFFPIQFAVVTGIVLSVVIRLYLAASDISLVELRQDEDGRIVEHKAPKMLTPHRVTVLDVYGSVFFAGAHTLDRLLPQPPEDGGRVAVVMRFRGEVHYGATLIEVLSSYARRLNTAHSRLYLSGISAKAIQEMKASGKLNDGAGGVYVYPATPVLGQATTAAADDARAWLRERG